jgi:hypothetical protein
MDGGGEGGELDRLGEVDVEPGRPAPLHVLLRPVSRQRDPLLNKSKMCECLAISTQQSVSCVSCVVSCGGGGGGVRASGKWP